jgi:hypothetical protein
MQDGDGNAHPFIFRFPLNVSTNSSSSIVILKQSAPFAKISLTNLAWP